MRTPSLLALVAVLGLAATVRAEDVVRIETGEISGAVAHEKGADDVRVFKGIPFAAPPTGRLRWRPPERAAAWEGVRACKELGPACPQPVVPFFSITEEQSEDCLYLNVWTPAKERNAKLPVMVWIHGGSYTIGSGGQDMYDGAALARRGVVLVTFNYRLGPFGFLSHPELSKEAAPAGSGNYGFLDQIAALEWVKRNIAAFGGDPGCVTVFGESAGGGSVMALLLSPLAKGLFHRAICQSGVCFARQLRVPAFSMEPAEKTGERLAEKLGCRSIEEMRARSAKDVLTAAAPGVNPLGADGMSFGLVVDGRALPDDPFVLMAKGAQADVPLLMGTTADEGSLFVAGSPHSKSRASYRRFVESVYGAEAERVLAAYPAASDEEVRGQLATLLADSLFVAPTRAFVRSRKDLRSPVFLYQFTRVTPTAKAFALGAHHGAELRYVFDTLDTPGAGTMTKTDRALARTMAGAWTRFAKTGDPNGDGMPGWPAYSVENDAHLELGDTVKAGTGLRRAECDFFEKVWTSLRVAPAGKVEKRWF